MKSFVPELIAVIAVYILSPAVCLNYALLVNFCDRRKSGE
jgi:hypothetical protein